VNQPSSTSLLLAGLQGLLATAICGFGLALLLLPQRLGQQPLLREGVLSVHVAADGSLRLWHQPLQRAELLTLLKEAARRQPGSRLRVSADPQLGWGRLRALLQELQRGPLPLELQLPAAPPQIPNHG
jgi:biopolymer transport protein ExbD